MSNIAIFPYFPFYLITIDSNKKGVNNMKPEDIIIIISVGRHM